MFFATSVLFIVLTTDHQHEVIWMVCTVQYIEFKNLNMMASYVISWRRICSDWKLAKFWLLFHLCHIWSLAVFITDLLYQSSCNLHFFHICQCNFFFYHTCVYIFLFLRNFRSFRLITIILKYSTCHLQYSSTTHTIREITHSQHRDKLSRPTYHSISLLCSGSSHVSSQAIPNYPRWHIVEGNTALVGTHRCSL